MCCVKEERIELYIILHEFGKKNNWMRRDGKPLDK